MRTALRIVATLLAFGASLPMVLLISVMAHVSIYGSAAQVPPKLVMPYEALSVLAPLLFGIWSARISSMLAGLCATLLVYFGFKLGAFATLLNSTLVYMAYGEIISATGMLVSAAVGVFVIHKAANPHL